MTLVFNDKARVAAWVAEQVGQQSSWGDFYAMGVEREGVLVAGILFNGLNDTNVYAHMAVTSPTRELALLLDHAFVYAFKMCKVRRVTATVDADNMKSLRLNTHVGFKRECSLSQAGSGGQDLEILVLWPENYYRGAH